MNSTDTFATLPLTVLVSSRTNPRTTFAPEWITELAESIADSGVHQPILVRPLPGSRVADTGRGVTHEIVAGECRWRASKQANMVTIPCMVKDLTDLQVMKIQLIENLKRKDLTELEEAEGYQALMQASAMSADEIGTEIKKSRSYVFGRLKLLELCTESRAALRTGTIDASRALLLARIPDHKLQIKALKDILTGGDYGYGTQHEPMSARRAATHIQEHYMCKLDSAKFDIKCIDLVPTAGSCSTCAKRTGHDPDLFSDVKSADVCTDAACFRQKELAHGTNLVEQARARGQTVINGKEALEIMGTGYQAKFKGYRRLDDPTDSPTDKPLRKIIGKQMEAEGIAQVMIEHPHKAGELIAALPNEVVLRLLKTVDGQAAAAKTVAKEVKEFAADKAKKAADKDKAKFEQGWRDDLLQRTWDTIVDIDDSVATHDLCRYYAAKEAAALNTERAEQLAALLDLGKVAPYAAVADWVKATPRPDHALALLTMHRDKSADDHDYRGHIANHGLMLVASIAFGNDGAKQTVADAKSELKAAMLEAKTAQTKLLPSAQARAAQAKGVRGAGPKGQGDKAPAAPASDAPLRKRKMSTVDAQAAIASAMQDQDTDSGADAQGIDVDSIQPVAAVVADAPKPSLAVDARVMITDDTDRLPITQHKYCGKVGTITQQMDDDRYMVTFLGRTGGMCAFDRADLQVTTALTTAPPPAAYRGPNGETWSGRGLKPRWVMAALDGGSTLDDLKVAA